VKDAPITYVVVRDMDQLENGERLRRLEVTGRPADDRRHTHRFDYRMVEGALMRSMMGPAHVTPLTLESMESDFIVENTGGKFATWLEHPGVRAAGICPVEGLLADRSSVVFQEILGDDSERVVAGTLARASAMRVVDGVPYKPAPPPCWAVGYLHDGSIANRLVIPDYDLPELGGDGSRRIRSACDFHPLAPFELGDGRAVRGEEFAALDDPHRVADVTALVGPTYGDSLRRDRHVLALLKKRFDTGFAGVMYDGIPRRLRAVIAALPVRLDDFHDGAVDIDAARELLETPGANLGDLDQVFTLDECGFLRVAARYVPLSLEGGRRNDREIADDPGLGARAR
jgi:hypothetical protein